MRCQHCGATVPDGYGITLGNRHGFCGAKCRDAWTPGRVLQLEAALSRIHIKARGKARSMALAALIGNLPNGAAPV